MTGHDEFQLEQFIDQHGLAETLEKIAEICSGKAEHIETNWQDRKTARPWILLSNAIAHVAHRAFAHSLSKG
jgi:hypothetical protein